MNQEQFLDNLKMQLSDLPDDEICEILYDYQEHFRVGKERGKTEEGIAKELGSPSKIAKSYKAYTIVEKAKENPSVSNLFRAVVATVALGFFNLVFIIGPFLGLMGIMIGLFVSCISIVLTGVAMTIIGPFQNLIGSGWNVSISIHPVASFFLGIGMTALGILLTILIGFIGKALIKGTLKYLRWNIDIVKKS